MTREGAKKSLTYFLNNVMRGSEFEADIIVDKIYDDFESRNCTQCKHFVDEFFCELHDRAPVHIFGQASDETYCHKWEKKDEQ